MAEPNARFRQNVRGFYAWLGSVVILGIAPMIAARLVERESLAARLAGVAVGVGGVLPWMLVVVVIVRRGDEFYRRIHLVALSIAFFGATLATLATHWLVRANFLQYADLQILWVLFLVMWIAALLGTKAYFERRP